MLLPIPYQQQMQHLLAEEFPRFWASYSESASKSLRVNRLKLSTKLFCERSPFHLHSIPWCPEGFSYDPTLDRPGKHVYHAAGLYYIQDASAMAAVEALDPQPGERILDLCAAPGGKTTQIAAKMDNHGLVVANEVDVKRSQTLVENLERCGVTIATVINEQPDRLTSRFRGFFDRLLIDAPCSGEGMFRKDRDARERWSPRLVDKCQALQQQILTAAAPMLRPGGRLVYSTCTFNPAENESVIASFLAQHPDFMLTDVPQQAYYQPGRGDWLDPVRPDLNQTARLWPHLLRGEGHFIAVLEKQGSFIERSNPQKPHKGKSQSLPKEVWRLFDAFCRQHLSGRSWSNEQFILYGEHLYQLPSQLPSLRRMRVKRPGRYLGQIKRSHFQPSHAFALSLQEADAKESLNFAPEDPQLHAYLRGETLTSAGESGWILITVDHHPLGWGKRVAPLLKNHYPKWLRWDAY